MTTETKGNSIVGNTYTLPSANDIETRWGYLYGEKFAWECNDVIKVLERVITNEGDVKYVTLNCQDDVLNTINLPMDFFNELDALATTNQYLSITGLENALKECHDMGVPVYFDTSRIKGIAQVKVDGKPTVLLSKE